MHEDATLYGCRPQPRRLCVRWRPSPIGMEVGLSPGDLVFDGHPATPRKNGTPSPPNFGPCVLWPNGWMDEDATWYGSRPWPRPLCIRRVRSYPRKGHSSPPLFSAHVYCGHGRPSQLLLSSCNSKDRPRSGSMNQVPNLRGTKHQTTPKKKPTEQDSPK